MTIDIFHHFKQRGGDQITSSAARAQLKAWDQRHESQPSWEEDYCDYESVMGVDDCGILPEEKWEYIKNPALTAEEVWKLCADESADERADRYGHRYDDIEECWGYDPYHPSVNSDYDDYDHYDDYDPYDEYYPCDYEWYESDRPSNVYYCYEMEQAAEKYIEDCKVWSETVQEVARFEESCDPPQPEPRPLISDHHYRKAA